MRIYESVRLKTPQRRLICPHCGQILPNQTVNQVKHESDQLRSVPHFQRPPWNIMLQNTIYLIENDTDSAIRGFQQVCQPGALSFCIKGTQGVLEHGGCSPKEAAEEEASPLIHRESAASVAAGSPAPAQMTEMPELCPSLLFFGGGSTDEHSSVVFVTLLRDSAAISKNLQLMSSEPFPVNSRPGVTHRRSLSATVIAFPGNRRPGKKRVLPGYKSRTTATQTQLCCFLINGLVTGLIMLLA